MSTKNDGGPAFPLSAYQSQSGEWQNSPEFGMSLRDWFAGRALSAIEVTSPGQATPERFAEVAYQIADAMIAERNKP